MDTVGRPVPVRLIPPSPRGAVLVVAGTDPVKEAVDKLPPPKLEPNDGAALVVVELPNCNPPEGAAVPELPN